MLLGAGRAHTPPHDRAGRDTLSRHSLSPTAERVQLSSTRDGHGGMEQVTLGANVATDAAAADYETIDESSGFPPKVLSCVATVALSPSPPDPVAMHRGIEEAKAGRQLWPEDVARFSDEEMEAALYALDQELPQPYSLAFFFTSKATAQGICEAGGGIRASRGRFGDAIVVCSKSPVELGWEKNGGGSFRPNVAQLLWGASPVTVHAGGRYAAELEVMVVLGVPTAMLRDSRNEYQPPDLWSIPAEYLTAAGLYSNAHVLKCYELGDPPAAPQTSTAGSRRSTTPPRELPPLSRLQAATRAVQSAQAFSRVPPPLPDKLPDGAP